MRRSIVVMWWKMSVILFPMSVMRHPIAIMWQGMTVMQCRNTIGPNGMCIMPHIRMIILRPSNTDCRIMAFGSGVMALRRGVMAARKARSGGTLPPGKRGLVLAEIIRHSLGTGRRKSTTPHPHIAHHQPRIRKTLPPTAAP